MVSWPQWLLAAVFAAKEATCKAEGSGLSAACGIDCSSLFSAFEGASAPPGVTYDPNRSVRLQFLATSPSASFGVTVAPGPGGTMLAVAEFIATSGSYLVPAVSEAK
jgi:hypothetical protein